MTDLKAHLDRIRESMPKLNKVSDDAAQLVRLVEKTLREIGAGIEASALFWEKDLPSKVVQVDHDTQYEQRKTQYSYLVYERIAGEFRVGISTQKWTLDAQGDRDELLHDETIDWSAADRTTKLASFQQLPKLIERIAEAVKELEKQTTATTAAVASVLAAIDPGKAPKPKTARGLCDEGTLVEWFEAQGISPINARTKARLGLVAGIKHSDLPLGLSGVQELIDTRVV